MAFTHDWFSESIPAWQKALAPMIGAPDLNFLEIGSFEGKSACWLLENVLTGPNSRIHCVDPWAGELLPRFLENTALWKAKVVAHQGKSEDVIPRLPGTFDFVYIDGLHMGFNVLQDAVMTWNKVKGRRRHCF